MTRALAIAAAVGAALVLPSASQAAYQDSDLPQEPGRIVVAFEPDVGVTDARSAIESAGGHWLRWLGRTNHHLVAVSETTKTLVRDRLEAMPDVRYTQPDYIHADRTSDPLFTDQWALENNGQLHAVQDDGHGEPDLPRAGIAGVDVDGPEVWARMGTVGVADTAVVAIVDSGFETDHPDIEPSLWQNPGELPANGIDDDANGYVDDVIGYDMGEHDADPDDSALGGSHGTHVAGIAAGTAANGIGTAGIAGHPGHGELMLLRREDDGHRATTAYAVEAWNYAVDNGADVINNSWGAYVWGLLNTTNLIVDPALLDASRRASEAGVVQVFAGGYTPDIPYPDVWDDFDFPGVLRVAATTDRDERMSGTNPNKLNMEVGAPGEHIIAPVPGGYAVKSGTSMAAPLVAGAAALLRAAYPDLANGDVAASIMEGVDRTPAMQTSVLSEGRLNANRALQIAGAK